MPEELAEIERLQTLVAQLEAELHRRKEQARSAPDTRAATSSRTPDGGAEGGGPPSLADKVVLDALTPIVDQLPVAIMIMDVQGRLLLINPEMRRLWRGDATHGDFQAFSLYRGWDSQRGAPMETEDWPLARAILEGVATQAMEVHFKRLDGSEGDMLVSSVPIRDAAGAVVAGVAVAQDVTALRASERKIAFDEDLLRRIGETTPDLIFAKDRQQRMIFANPAFLRIAGKRWDEIEGRTEREWRDAPDDTQEEVRRVGEDDEAVMSSGLDHRFEEALTGPAGRQTFLASKTPLRDASGAVIGLFGISTDITARKADEARLRAQGEALRRAQESLAAIFNASSEGLTLCRLIRDEAGRAVDYQVLDVNPAHARLTGATREQMLSLPVSKIAPPVDPRWFSSAEQAIATRQVQSFEVYSKVTRCWLDIHVAPVLGDVFAQTFIDVTARRAIEEQRARFLVEMNHRVKNNFQMVASVLNIQARRSGNAEVRAHLTTAQQRIQLLAKLHDRLSAAPNAEDLDFRDYLLSLCDQLRALIDEPERIRLEATCEAARLHSRVATALGFVVNELVTNAVKYAFPSGASGQIRVAFTRDGDGYRLEVGDDGKGLDDGPAPGGMGRRLVASFVDQIGGALELRHGPGLHYTILIPPQAPE
jgi:PAS domain S-box-containing protein